MYLSRIHADDCLNEIDNKLADIKTLNENPKRNFDLYLTDFIYDNILSLIHLKGCLNKNLSLEEVNSTECCRLISLLAKTKKIFIPQYIWIKIKKNVVSNTFVPRFS